MTSVLLFLSLPLARNFPPVIHRTVNSFWPPTNLSACSVLTRHVPNFYELLASVAVSFLIAIDGAIIAA